MRAGSTGAALGFERLDAPGRARDRACARKSGENAERTSPIRRFNDLTFQRITRRQPVLELGSVPMPVVTARIDRFIAEGGKGPYPDME
jgi:hypothetical protein